jgi:hypothetical protein
MINESELNYKRGDLVEFKLSLGGGPKDSVGLILNTAVLFGRAARQLWIVEIKDSTPALDTAWLNKKHLVHETDIFCGLPSVFIGRETLLRENPVCFPVRNMNGLSEIPAVMVSVALPVARSDIKLEVAQEPESVQSPPE